MTYVFMKLFWWLLAALVIGLATGWLTFNRNVKSWKLGWLSLWLGLFVIGCILAFLKVLPDRAGFWLETALFTFAAFIIGCLLGSWLGSFARRSIYVGDHKHPLDVADLAIPGVAAVAATGVASLARAASTGGEGRSEFYPGAQPLGVVAPATGGDDLKRIYGIGPKNEKTLNELGVWRFCQVGDWTAENAAWIGHHIKFPGRIEREHWVEQGKLLCQGMETDHAKGVRTGSIRFDEDSDAPLNDDDIALIQRQLVDARARGVTAPVGASVRPAAALAANGHQGVKPAGIATPADGGDDLKLICGIGPKNEKILKGLGIWRFCQIGDWTAANVDWVNHHIAFPGRIEREQWVEQGKLLCQGVETDYAHAVRSGAIKVDDSADNPLSDDDVAKMKLQVSNARAATTDRAAADRIAAERAAQKAAADKAAAERAAAEKLAADKAAAERAAAEKLAADKAAAERAAAEKLAADKAAAERAAAEKLAAEKAAAERAAAGKAAADKAAAERAAAEKLAAEKAAAERAAAGKAAAAGAAAVMSAPRASGHPGAKPFAVAAPHNGGDDLKLIRGIGPKNEQILHDLGVWRFCQIGDWTAANVEWVNHHIAFPGRIEREQWVEQGRLLCAGVETDFAKAVRSGAIRIDDSSDAPLSDAQLAEVKQQVIGGNREREKRMAETHPGARPAGMEAPVKGGDDLKLIRGIGPKNEQILNALGVWRFCQIGAWTPANAEWVNHHIAFPGRIEREQWIEQGKLLCAGFETEHSRAVRAGSIRIDEKSDNALSDAELTALRSSLPELAGAIEGEDMHEGKRPLGFASARGGLPDDLKLIRGIGPKNEGLLHGLGVWHFDQIAAWTEEHALWIGSYLAFPGRIEREEWVAQAKILSDGGSTEFAERVKKGEVPTSVDDGSHGQDNILPVEDKSH